MGNNAKYTKSAIYSLQFTPGLQSAVWILPPIILPGLQSAIYPRSEVCCLQFTPGLQSAVCFFTLTVITVRWALRKGEKEL